MLEPSCFLFSLFLLLTTICVVRVDLWPQSRLPVRNFSEPRKDHNHSAITFIKKLPLNASRIIGKSNTTKTRILFRGELDYNDQSIIFPDAFQVIFDHLPRISGPPKCANGDTFCENFDSYPYHHVKDVLQRHKFHNDLFGKDEAPDEEYAITNRNSDIESFICTSVQQTIFPRVGKNKNNKWKFIINQEENEGYIQGVRIETCKKEGSACDLIGERLNGYITSCKQKYMMRRLLSLSENGDPAPDTFQLPSACCCSYRKDLSFLSRYGQEDMSLRVKAKKN